jgi:hypothetical protein
MLCKPINSIAGLAGNILNAIFLASQGIGYVNEPL